LLATAMILAVACLGCSDPEEEARLAHEKAQAEAWTALQETQQALASTRAELAEVTGQIAASAEEVSEATEEQIAEWKSKAKEIQGQAVEQSERFNQQIIEFINNAGVVEGEEPPENVKAAFRMKSDEEILIAREYIDKGGDYSRAIEIYEAALKIDPDYQKLKDEIVTAEEMRWMSKERFDLAKKDMTQDEIRATLGPVNQRFVQVFPDRNVISWFYPKGKEAGAAGVYFKKSANSEYRVYLLDFNAVKPKSSEPDQEG
jgi:tetratricopeptide (TPR) repeat protein